MARLTIDYGGFGKIEAAFDNMSRGSIRKIVEAGAAADVEEMRKDIVEARHVRTGSMRDSVRAGDYHETLGGGYMSVYPQGEDRHGVSNTVKAFVINYGRGKKKRTARMGDKFITGHEDRTEQVVTAAMQAEADRLVDELNR